MEEKCLVLSDIHGNVSAFDAVLEDCKGEYFTGVILLGDCIDYGMRSNEILKTLCRLCETHWKGKIIAHIWGNHEKLMVDGDLEQLSSDRGRTMANYTAKHLSLISVQYIKNYMNHRGMEEFEMNGLKCLAVHGSLEDPYWKAVEPENLHGAYAEYDMVFSGHSHCSHFFTHFYRTENQAMRNRKAVTFVNPGSVGQPRNQNPCAQYAVVYPSSKRVELRTVLYDVAFEQSLFPDEVDAFYKTRLARGI